jgi:hypothetical protein
MSSTQFEQNEVAKPEHKTGEHVPLKDNLSNAVQIAPGDKSFNTAWNEMTQASGKNTQSLQHVLNDLTIFTTPEIKDFMPPNPGGGLKLEPWPGKTETHLEIGKNGEIETVSKTTNWDGSTAETTERPNGDKETIKKDKDGRETEHSKSHKGPFGDDMPDEVKVTKYDTKTGLPETTTTKYDDRHNPLEKETRYSDGRKPDLEAWLYDANGKVALHVKNNEVVNDEVPILRQ